MESVRSPNPSELEEARMVAGKKPLVVVIDRSSEILTWLYSVLYGEGFLVATCTPTLEALRYVSSYKPDLAIVGWEALKGDDSSLLRKIREISPETKILLMAVSTDEPSETEALGAGADLLLRNPYVWGDISTCVARLLGGRYPAKEESTSRFSCIF
jgi:DNA-binding response OmpR family regulator